MTCIGKIVLAFAILQVALVLAKPYEPENDDGLYHSNDALDDFFYKRGGNIFTIDNFDSFAFYPTFGFSK